MEDYLTHLSYGRRGEAILIHPALRYSCTMTKYLAQGVVQSTATGRRTDYLFRVSIKCLIKDDDDRVLVVKESGRSWWDLPGGGMDHGEDLKTAIARELAEEVNLTDDFEYKILYAENPAYLRTHDFWQLRLIFEVKPISMKFSIGEDGDEVAFVAPEEFRDSKIEAERTIYKYSKLSDR